MAHISTNTRKIIKYDIVRHFNQEDEALHGLPVPMTTTGGGSTTTLVDTTLSRGTTDGNRYDGRIIEIVEKVGSGPELNEVAAVDSGGLSSSTITVSPAFTGTVETGTDYLPYPRNLSPDTVHEKISEVLRTTDAPHLFMPSLVEDAAFEVGDITTNWTTQGSPTTSERITTAANVFLGDAVFHFIADAANEGTASDAIDVTKGEQLTLSTFVRANVGSVQVILYNNTAGENIKAITIDKQAWTEVRFTETVPDDCEQVSVRYLSVAGSDDFYISAYVTLQSQNARPYDLPTWFTHEGMFEGAHYIPLGVSSEDPDSYIALSRTNGNVEIEPEFLRSDRAVHPLKVQLQANLNLPIAFTVRRPFADLTTDAAATHADREYVVAKAIHNIMQGRRQRDIIYGKRAARIAKRLDYGRPKTRIREDKMVFV